MLTREKVENEANTKSEMNIIEILNKAQSSYQLKATDQTKNDQSYLEQPKPIIGWPNDYVLDKNNYLKPEPIRVGPTIAKAAESNQDDDASNSNNRQDQCVGSESSNSSNKKLSLFQRLVSASEKNETSCDLLSLDLKKKLNIMKVPQTFQDDISLSSMTQVNSTESKNGTFFNTNSLNEVNSDNRKLMTVKDFEENLLNESCKLFFLIINYLINFKIISLKL